MSSLTMNDKELERLRADIEAVVMPDTCNILTVTRTSDGQGGFTEAWGTAVRDVACRLDPVDGRELVAGSVSKPYHTYWLSLPYETSIDEQSLVEISTADYTVIGVDTGKSWSGSVRVLVERI